MAREVTPDEARDALARVLESAEFAQAARLSAFLRYVVGEALAGRGAAIKGYAIAVDVFDRPADFDQASDPIVRVEASRLRRALAQYYQGSGRADRVLIDLPRGAYVPSFQWRDGSVPEESEPEPAPVDEAEALVLPAPSQPVRDPMVGLRRIGLFVAGLTCLGLSAILFLVWQSVQSDRASSPTSTVVHAEDDGVGHMMPQVAVLPVEVLGGQGDDQLFARGLTNELVAELARFRGLSVSVLAGEQRPGQGYLVVGSARRGQNEIRVTVQLVTAVGGRTLWSDTFDRAMPAQSMLAVEDDIARSVAIAVGQPYGAIYERELAEARAHPGRDPAYECVLRAYEYWRTMDAASHAGVRECLEQAVAKDPAYADAWQMLTYFYVDEYRYGYNARGNYNPLQKALTAAQTSVALSPTDARSYQSLYVSYFYLGDREGFKKAGGEALKLNPNSPDVLADFGNKLAVSGGWAEGIPMVRRAMSLNPGHPGWYFVPLVLDAYRNGRYPEALALLERMNTAGQYRQYVFAAMIYGQMGELQKASEALAQVTRLKPDFAANADAEMHRWGFDPALIQLCMAGLTKAGIASGG